MDKILIDSEQIKKNHININSVQDYCEFSGAHAGWKDINCCYQGLTDNSVSIFNADRASQLIGQSDYEILDRMYADIYVHNDRKVITSEESWFGLEVADWHGFGKIVVFSNKAPLYNKDFSEIVGTIFLCYPLTESSFGEKELNFIREFSESNKAKLNSFNLSPREQECLKLTVEGLTAKQIARKLGVSFRTVEFHINNLKDKMKCNNKYELIRKAIQQS